MLLNAYVALVVKHPKWVLAALVALVLGLGWGVQDFRLDASADSLVVEGDADLEFSREINARYGAGDFVFVAYTPEQELFSSDTLADLRALRDELLDIDGVESVDSILTIPLFKVADASLRDVTDNIITLEAPEVDLDAARDDLTTNDAYLDVLLNAEGTTTALIVNFERDTELEALLASRTELQRRARTGDLDREGEFELARTEVAYAARRGEASQALHTGIAAIRATLDEYRDGAEIVMGGVPMIADDLVSFVRGDLEVFGGVILVFIIVALAALFRQPRYVVLPLACGLAVTVCMVGLLGLLDWPVTVISSNFVSLLLIATVSLTIHLIVRYRELQDERPDMTHEHRLTQTLRDMSAPALYTALTTVVAFASLITSSIPPIIDFGWMMFIGIASAFVLTFLLFPSAMALLPAPKQRAHSTGLDITPAVGRFTDRRGRPIVIAAIAMLVFAVLGIRQLRVENSFIEYFDKDTDIYQGMVVIDEELGGTTPLDVIIDLAPPNPFGDDAGFDDAEFDFGDEEEDESDSEWFTSDKMARIIAIHDWLDALPETGKVLSLATLLNIAYELNDGEALSSFEL
ncbi:MAG: efflux RND transporter permease subunit, partial [Gammaproteobacteria bacterium]